LATNEAGKLGNSDHCIIENIINAGCELAQCVREIICWNQANFENMRDELSLIDWQAVFVNKNTEECWTIFTEKLRRSAEINVPRKNVKINGKQKWLTREIIRMVRRKKTAWREYKHTGTAEAREEYLTLEKDLKKSIRRAKRKQERDLVKNDDRNGKKFTQYIKSKTKTRSGIGPLKKSDGP
jgi:hypothetical protein